MSTNIEAEKAENAAEIEMQFAVKAVEQAQIYWSLLGMRKGTELRLTKYDDEIFEDLKKTFPEFEDPKTAEFVNEEEMKSAKGKAAWRPFMMRYQKKIDDYNFGTLLRVRNTDEYEQDTTIFVPRMQFFAFEIARNKYGLNDWICKK
ncbi:DUF757 family protein [Schizosaccharomyces cryophilus OY26]|uniref:Protein PBDC1 homolog n=1 Tax=Schizosaccharomyces cryophilus (strain OY26 / ATCC MYA-4695 / CBS 11777 / NBRC 106824 / NRRL Y48691) TaxID=653667 RepID=S9W5N7_SCHCR|nr:DUF757 family protein [Schizosaccharomyces cryophilus OY26]EPY53869.1 DUF757 family protein [Schizosaccharomyces cryophilus OY26]